MSGGPAYSHPSAAGGGMGGANLMVGASTGMAQSGGMGERIKEAVEASIGDLSNLAKSRVCCGTNLPAVCTSKQYVFLIRS